MTPRRRRCFASQTSSDPDRCGARRRVPAAGPGSCRCSARPPASTRRRRRHRWRSRVERSARAGSISGPSGERRICSSSDRSRRRSTSTARSSRSSWAIRLRPDRCPPRPAPVRALGSLHARPLPPEPTRRASGLASARCRRTGGHCSVMDYARGLRDPRELCERSGTAQQARLDGAEPPALSGASRQCAPPPPLRDPAAGDRPDQPSTHQAAGGRGPLAGSARRQDGALRPPGPLLVPGTDPERRSWAGSTTAS